MPQQAIPLPTGLKVSDNFPKAREKLTNCFMIQPNRIVTRPGIIAQNTAVGACRGAEFYRRKLFHASGESIVIIPEDQDATVTTLGTIGGADQVFFAEGHTALAILARGGQYFKWENTGGNGTLTDITATENFETSVDIAFMDGRWFFCPATGGPIFFTEVGQPDLINALNFFDAELLPDPNLGLINVRNTLYVLGGDSIEAFRSTGDVDTPISRVQGAQIQSGYIGGRIEYGSSFAYLGRNIDGHTGIFIAGPGTALKISNDAVDDILLSYSLPELSLVKSMRYTWHGADVVIFTFFRDTIAYSMGEWHVLTSDLGPSKDVPWRAVFNQFAYGRYYVGDLDTADIGILDIFDEEYGGKFDREIDTFVRIPPDTQ